MVLLLFLSFLCCFFFLLLSTALVYNSGPYFLCNFIPVWSAALWCVLESISWAPHYRLIARCHISPLVAVLCCCWGYPMISQALASTGVVKTNVSPIWCSFFFFKRWGVCFLSSPVFFFFFYLPCYVKRRPCNALVMQFLLRCFRARALFGSPNVVRLLMQADCIKVAACLVIPWAVSVSRRCHLAMAATLGQMRCYRSGC